MLGQEKERCHEIRTRQNLCCGNSSRCSCGAPGDNPEQGPAGWRNTGGELAAIGGSRRVTSVFADSRSDPHACLELGADSHRAQVLAGQLDFGAIEYSASSKRPFSLTPPLAGDITLEFPAGSFVLAELRRVPPINLGGKGQSTRAVVPPMKPTPTSSNGQTELYKWNFAAGEEMQLDILFAPSFSKDKTPGPRAATMKFSGPGPISPWTLLIPMRGFVTGALLQPALVPGPPAQTKQPAAQAKPPGSTPSSNSIAPGTVVARATPSSAPPLVQGAVPVLNKPVYSPDQFDFGEVWDGDLAKKTFHVTTNAAGYVTIQIPKGTFRVAEFRELGAVQASSKNPGSKSQGPNLAPIREVKSRIKYQEGESGPFQWSMAPNADIEIDIFFQPHFNLFTETAGQKSAAMKVTGPGPHGNWALSVPLVGMFDGLKLSATMAPETKEILAIAGEKYVPVNITLFGLNTPVSGTVRAGSQLPPGVSVISKSVKVGANEKLPVTVWLSLGNINVPQDRSPQPLELVFDDGKKTSKAMFQFIGLPGSLTLSSGERNDCVVSHLRLTLTLQAPMHNKITGGSYIPKLDESTGDPGTGTYDLQMSMPKGLHTDGYAVGSFMVYAETGGVSVFNQSYWPDYETQNGTELKKTGPAGAGRGPRQWMQILDGQARFGCQLSRYLNHDPNKIPELLCGPNYECTKIKWAPMQ